MAAAAAAAAESSAPSSSPAAVSSPLQHRKQLAEIARLLQIPGFYRKLVEAKTAEEMLSVIAAEEPSVALGATLASGDTPGAGGSCAARCCAAKANHA